VEVLAGRLATSEVVVRQEAAGEEARCGFQSEVPQGVVRGHSARRAIEVESEAACTPGRSWLFLATW
jgi:hypothetical protein